jgi:hypothetical protein
MSPTLYVNVTLWFDQSRTNKHLSRSPVAVLVRALLSSAFGYIKAKLVTRFFSSFLYCFAFPLYQKMFVSDGIRSRLEWASTLSTANAPVPTESTKYLRKVGNLTNGTEHGLTEYSDVYHRDHRSVFRLLHVRC